MPSFDYSVLADLNALLNATAAVLLVFGLILIKRKNYKGHGWVMGCAFAVSSLFLISYLTYHAKVGSVKFQGTGFVRFLYFAILISHIILAAVVAPTAIVAVWHAAHRRFDRHKSITKWLYPIWLYVSITGVVIYAMLYWLPV